jgi:hypothetical protein
MLYEEQVARRPTCPSPRPVFGQRGKDQSKTQDLAAMAAFDGI